MGLTLEQQMGSSTKAADIFLLGKHRAMYTGTDWKLERNQKHIERFANSWSGRMAIPVTNYILEQIAAPAVEPNHFIDQCALIVGKAKNQVTSLIDAIAYPDKPRDGKLVIPDWVKEMYFEGGTFSFLASDVGVREKFGYGVWEMRRNFYLKARERYDDTGAVNRLEKELLGYYGSSDLYGSVNKDDPAIRAIDSSIAITQVTWKPLSKYCQNTGIVNEPTSVKIYPTNSVVGVQFEKHPLASPSLREGFIDFIKSKSKVEHLSEVQLLRDMHGRAGGLKTEWVYEYAVYSGIQADILADGEDEASKVQDLIEHVHGAPYKLLRDQLLTMLEPAFECKNHCVENPHKFLLENYPSGARSVLRV